MQRWLLIGMFALALFALAGCGTVDTAVTLDWNENWSFSSTTTLDAQEVQMAGGPDYVMAIVNQNLNERRSVASGMGASFDGSAAAAENGTISARISGSGSGFEALNRVVFGGSPLQRYESEEESTIDFSLYSLLMDAARYRLSITLEGGSITAANASSVSGRTMVWENIVTSGAEFRAVMPLAQPTTGHRLTVFEGGAWLAETTLTVDPDQVNAIGDLDAIRGQLERLLTPLSERAGALGLPPSTSTQQEGGSFALVQRVTGKDLTEANRYLFAGQANLNPTADGYRLVYPVRPELQGSALTLAGASVIDAGSGTDEGSAVRWDSLAGAVDASLAYAPVRVSLSHAVEFTGGQGWRAVQEVGIDGDVLAAIGSERWGKLWQAEMIPLAERAQRVGAEEITEIHPPVDAAAQSAEFRGKGIDALNTLLFDGRAELKPTSPSSERTIDFAYTPEGDWAQYRLELRGGSFKATNAPGAGENYAAWSEWESTPSATATVRLPTSKLWYWLLGAAAAVVASAVWLLLRPGAGAAAPASTPPPVA